MTSLHKELNRNQIEEYFDLHENHFVIYAHDRGWTSIGSLTCLQIHLPDLFKDGFNTGHGYLREPGGIKTAFMLSAIAILVVFPLLR